MSIEIEKEDGTKEVVYSTEEYTAKDTEITDLKGKLTELERINATRSSDFTAYSKMSEEDKKAFDANTTNLLKNEETLRNQIADLTGKLSDKEKRDNDAAKNHAMSSIHHNDEKTKNLLEEKYALLAAMPENTPDDIAARTREAAKLAGIQIDPRNPMYTSFSGEAPQYKQNSEYVDTPDGKIAADMARKALGLSDNK